MKVCQAEESEREEGEQRERCSPGACAWEQRDNIWQLYMMRVALILMSSRYVCAYAKGITCQHLLSEYTQE